MTCNLPPGPAVLPWAGATPVAEPELATDQSVDPGWKVLLFNDDVTPFDDVILALQRAAGLSVEVAEMVAQEAHLTGQAVVRRGLTKEDAEIICGLMRHLTRREGRPGVVCDAVHDTAE